MNITFYELKNLLSYREIVEDIDIHFANLRAMELKTGFSANAARQLKRKYPHLDLNDLLTNYPQKPRNISYD